MKIGILTFHAAFNYGSMLQAWALQCYIQNLGHDVEIINLRTLKQKKIYRRPFISLKPYDIFCDCKRILKYGKQYFNTYQRWEIFEDFLCKNLILSREYNEEQWIKSYKNYDCIITGSDQIWNLDAKDFTPIYLGEGIDHKIRLIAYGPSLGPNPENLNKGLLQVRLNYYNYVSVREDRALNFLVSENIHSRVDKVLDPTLLLNFSSYKKFISPLPPTSFTYAYYYTPGKHNDILNKALSIGQLLNLPMVIDTGFFNVRIPKSSNVIIESKAGPKEFLSYIYHSKLVIGASFHLIIFAILMHKDFLCINGDKDSRMNSLLKSLQLENRIISLESHNMPYENLEPIDWDKVDSLLNEQRKSSQIFLNKALS